MQRSHLINWRYVVGLIILPLLILAVVLLVGLVQGWTRYDPAYFTEKYKNRYQTPASLISGLEQAWNSGNSSLLGELQGTRWKRSIDPRPQLRFLMFIRADGKYLDYLFLDYSNYHRYSFHLKKINGRYVSVPENLYYFVDSGHWVRTFAPVFAIWLLILSLFVFGTWLYRSLAEYRRETMEKPLPR